MQVEQHARGEDVGREGAEARLQEVALDGKGGQLPDRTQAVGGEARRLAGRAVGMPDRAVSIDHQDQEAGGVEDVVQELRIVLQLREGRGHPAQPKLW